MQSESTLVIGFHAEKHQVPLILLYITSHYLHWQWVWWCGSNSTGLHSPPPPEKYARPVLSLPSILSVLLQQEGLEVKPANRKPAPSLSLCQTSGDIRSQPSLAIRHSDESFFSKLDSISCRWVSLLLNRWESRRTGGKASLALRLLKTSQHDPVCCYTGQNFARFHYCKYSDVHQHPLQSIIAKIYL